MVVSIRPVSALYSSVVEAGERELRDRLLFLFEEEEEEDVVRFLVLADGDPSSTMSVLLFFFDRGMLF